MMPMPVNRITSQCKKKKLSQKIMPVNKFRTLKFLLILPSMNGQFFLDYYLCSAIHVYTDQFADMGIIVIRPPWLRCEFLAELPALSGHKQRCWTVLSELRYKVAYNPNTFFLNWKQRSAEKAVEDALQFNKMCVAGV